MQLTRAQVAPGVASRRSLQGANATALTMQCPDDPAGVLAALNVTCEQIFLASPPMGCDTDMRAEGAPVPAGTLVTTVCPASCGACPAAVGLVPGSGGADPGACVDDPDGVFAGQGMTCDVAVGAMACDTDLAQQGAPVPAGTLLTAVCPAACGACGGSGSGGADPGACVDDPDGVFAGQGMTCEMAATMLGCDPSSPNGAMVLLICPCTCNLPEPEAVSGCVDDSTGSLHAFLEMVGMFVEDGTKACEFWIGFEGCASTHPMDQTPMTETCPVSCHSCPTNPLCATSCVYADWSTGEPAHDSFAPNVFEGTCEYSLVPGGHESGQRGYCKVADPAVCRAHCDGDLMCTAYKLGDATTLAHTGFNCCLEYCVPPGYPDFEVAEEKSLWWLRSFGTADSTPTACSNWVSQIMLPPGLLFEAYPFTGSSLTYAHGQLDAVWNGKSPIVSHHNLDRAIWFPDAQTFADEIPGFSISESFYRPSGDIDRDPIVLR